MKIFETVIRSTKFQFICQSENTRSGFRHLCTPFVNGVRGDRQKCTYTNRTYERYQFESVLHKTIDSLKLSEEITQKLKDNF